MSMLLALGMTLRWWDPALAAPEMDREVLFILKRRKVRLRRVRGLVQGHMARKQTGLVECSFLGRKGPCGRRGKAGAAWEPAKLQCV